MISSSVIRKLPASGTFTLPAGFNVIRHSLSKKWLHVIFWLGFYIFNSLLEGSFLDDYYNGFYASFIKLPLQIAVVYFNIYYLLPKWIPTKNYSSYFVSLIILLALVVMFKRLLIFEYIYPYTCPVTYDTESLITFSNFFLMLNSEVYLIGLTSAIKMSVNWTRNIQTTKALEKEKLEAELSLLKAQIQPHFFFNTLNNLYALTLKKSDQAPDIVQKLSELMSYLLYDCEGDKVPLQEEVKLIHNYLDLEKLRYGKRLQLKVEMKGGLSDKMIPPFIILPFVENAFKHGQANLSSFLIEISLIAEQDHLLLKVKNPVAEVCTDLACTKGGGIGLKNVQRRLQLLYGSAFSLDVQKNAKEYQVSLRIPFNTEEIKDEVPGQL